MLNNRIPSRTSLISTKTGKLDKPLQHLFIIPPFVFVFKLLLSLPPSTLLCNPIIWAQRLFGYGIRTLLLVLRQTDTGLILMHIFKASHHESLKMTLFSAVFCLSLCLSVVANQCYRQRKEEPLLCVLCQRLTLQWQYGDVIVTLQT